MVVFLLIRSVQSSTIFICFPKICLNLFSIFVICSVLIYHYFLFLLIAVAQLIIFCLVTSRLHLVILSEVFHSFCVLITYIISPAKMSWWPCYGRKCKLGWGWNESLHQLIPAKGRSLDITSETLNTCEYRVYNLSSDHLVCWASFLFIN